MVRDEIADGERIARLLSSEVHGHERGSLGRLSVVDAEADVEPSADGDFAYAVALDAGDGEDGSDGAETDASGDGDGRRIAEVYVHPDRARVEFRDGVEAAATVGEAEGLRVRPKAVEPPRTLVFVENGAEVKGALRVVRAVADGRLEDGR
jgi:hypothetical protein